MLNLGFLSPHNPYDRGTFSGTAFFAARALARRPCISLRILGPHRAPRRIDRLPNRLLHRPPPVPDPSRLDLSGLDAVLGLVASPLLDRLQDLHGLPCLHVTDASPEFLREFYGWDIPEAADTLERRITGRAAAWLRGASGILRATPSCSSASFSSGATRPSTRVIQLPTA